MSGIRDAAIKKVAKYRKDIMDEIQQRCVKYIDELCDLAIEYRLNNENAHNFTGNLMNAIAVGLYRKGKLVEARFSSDSPDVGPALWEKMSGPALHRFNYDYDGGDYFNEGGSTYWAEVKTDRGKGITDAHSFIGSYKPEGHHLFDIVLAYTTEYALFIERVRKSTGIIGVYSEAPSIAMHCLELGKSN